MSSSNESRADEARIRELLAEQGEAMRTKDPELLYSRVSEDFVRYDLAPPLRVVGAQARDVAAQRAWFEGFEGPLHFEMRDLSVTVGGDVAFCHSLNRLEATPKGASESFELWCRATIGLRKIDGDWWVCHEHTSTPFYMDGSFLAATDLKP